MFNIFLSTVSHGLLIFLPEEILSPSLKVHFRTTMLTPTYYKAISISCCLLLLISCSATYMTYSSIYPKELTHSNGKYFWCMFSCTLLMFGQNDQPAHNQNFKFIQICYWADLFSFQIVVYWHKKANAKLKTKFFGGNFNSDIDEDIW